MPSLLRRLFSHALHGAQRAQTRRGPIRSGRYSLTGVQNRVERARGKFIDSAYRNKFGTRRYKLFVPEDSETASLPLLVMLHGCTQTPDEFALATGMNDLAADHRFAVVYPAQSVAANRSRCWNWFRPSDQQRSRGEPAILAGLTRHLIKAYGLDRRRVYVAGLSAGAAMAVILGRAYPDLYAAIGVHSGLPYAAAHDVSSAFAAMRGESTALGREAGSARCTPMIAFHGDRDRVVHSKNLQRLFDEFVDGQDSSALSTEHLRIDPVSGNRSCTHTRVRNANGMMILEHWLVHGGGHAWFGGGPSMRHADPDGPNASLAMLQFFFEHRLE